MRSRRRSSRSAGRRDGADHSPRAPAAPSADRAKGGPPCRLPSWSRPARASARTGRSPATSWRTPWCPPTAPRPVRRAHARRDPRLRGRRRRGLRVEPPPRPAAPLVRLRVLLPARPGRRASLACATENRSALLLEVAASGRYIRYERGPALQQAARPRGPGRPVRVRPPGHALADAGSGLIGWRHLAPVCDPVPRQAGAHPAGVRRPPGRRGPRRDPAVEHPAGPRRPAKAGDARAACRGGRTTDRGPCRGDSAVARPPGRPTVSARQVTAISHSRGRSPPYHLTVT